MEVMGQKKPLRDQVVQSAKDFNLNLQQALCLAECFHPEIPRGLKKEVVDFLVKSKKQDFLAPVVKDRIKLLLRGKPDLKLDELLKVEELILI